MKVFAVLLVSLATASSVVDGWGSPAVQLQLETVNGPRTCGASLINSRWALSAAHCTSGAHSGKVIAGYNGSISKPLIAPSFISHPNFDVSLIYLGLDLTSLNISYPTFYTDTIEDGQVGIVKSLYPGYMESVNVTFRGNDYCSQFIANYSSSMFCTDKCVKIPGSGVWESVNGIVGVVAWNLSPYPPEYKGPCAYTRISAYSPWIDAKIGAY